MYFLRLHIIVIIIIILHDFSENFVHGFSTGTLFLNRVNLRGKQLLKSRSSGCGLFALPRMNLEYLGLLELPKTTLDSPGLLRITPVYPGYQFGSPSGPVDCHSCFLLGNSVDCCGWKITLDYSSLHPCTPNYQFRSPNSPVDYHSCYPLWITADYCGWR